MNKDHCHTKYTELSQKLQSLSNRVLFHFFYSTMDGTVFHPDPMHKLSAHLLDIHHCCVYS